MPAGRGVATRRCLPLRFGTGDSTARTTPTAVLGGRSFISLSAGDYHTCGIAPGGSAYCWGWNSFSQLGTGDSTSSATPVPVAGGLAFVSLTTGLYHTCGVTTGGVTYCWGAERLVGDGSPNTAPDAVRLAPREFPGSPKPDCGPRAQ